MPTFLIVSPDRR